MEPRTPWRQMPAPVRRQGSRCAIQETPYSPEAGRSRQASLLHRAGADITAFCWPLLREQRLVSWKLRCTFEIRNYRSKLPAIFETSLSGNTRCCRSAKLCICNRSSHPVDTGNSASAGAVASAQPTASAGGLGPSSDYPRPTAATPIASVCRGSASRGPSTFHIENYGVQLRVTYTTSLSGDTVAAQASFQCDG